MYKRIDKLSDKTEALSDKTETLRSNMHTSINKLSDKLSDKTETLRSDMHTRMEKLADNTEDSIEKLSSEMSALRSDTNTSVVVLRSDFGNAIRQLVDQKIDSTNAKLDTEIGNLKDEIHAPKMNLERPMTDSGSVKNITRDAHVEPDT
jgi:gas vesicle protein